jgi:DNA-directed RNA polymerase subunit RPC12/RpoP
MAFTTLCPKCGWTPRYSDESEGNETACPECGHRFIAKPVPLQERAIPRWMRAVYGFFTFWR